MKKLTEAMFLGISLAIFLLFVFTGLFHCNGDVCFYSPDSYYYFHESENILNGEISTNNFAWVEFGFWKFAGLFYPISIYASICAFSIVLGSLSLILIYFICRKIHSIEMGILASLLFSINYLMVFIFRYAYGDIESFLIFLLLCFILIFVYLEKSKFLWFVCLVALCFMYLFWDGFVFLFPVSLLAFFAYFYLTKRINASNVALILGITVIFLDVEFPKIIERLFIHPYFVSELAGMGLFDIIQSVGILVLFSAIGIYFIFTNKWIKNLKILFFLSFFATGILLCFFISRMIYFLAIILIIFASYGLIFIKVRFKNIFIPAAIVIASLCILNSILVSGISPFFSKGDFDSASSIRNDSFPGWVICWWDEGNFYSAVSGKRIVLKGFPVKSKMDKYIAAMQSEDINYSIENFEKLCDCSLFYIVISPRMQGYFANATNGSFFNSLQHGIGCFSELNPGRVWRYDCGDRK